MGTTTCNPCVITTPLGGGDVSFAPPFSEGWVALSSSPAGGLRLQVGAPIATAPGMVMQTVGESRSGYGIYVRVHHGFGISTLYAHCSELAVEEGQRVDRGDVIAYVGATGSATGHHLHYEVRFGSQPGRNPSPYIRLK